MRQREAGPVRKLSSLFREPCIHRTARFSNGAGVTAIETLTVIAILVVILAITVVSFALFQQERDLDGVSDGLASTLEQARTQTLASKNQTVYGVHVEAGQYVLFEGVAYVPGAATNQAVALPSSIEISGWALAGGGAEAAFERLTGKTNQPGTITVRIRNRPDRTKTITILATGIVASQ